MNQEQNNLNPNNFNIQGNNEMPNNQPLNDQNYNNTFNQNVSANQPTFNPEPQPMNTFVSGDTNNKSFNIKPPKKMNLGLIAGVVAAVVAVGFGAVALLSGNKLTNQGNSSNTNQGNSSNANQTQNVLTNPQVQLTGKVKLVKKFENYSGAAGYSGCDENFSVLRNEKEIIVVNSVGETLATTTSDKKIKQCLEDGTIFILESDSANPTYSIHRNNKKIYSFTEEDAWYTNTSFISYDDGIIYYRQDKATGGGIVAYDLNNQKKVWQIDSTGKPLVLDDVVLVGNSTIVSKKTGAIIDKSTEEYDVHASEGSYYARVYNGSNDSVSKVEIYNYNKKLISTMSFNEKCLFKYIMSNGFYVISFPDTMTRSVYDFNSKIKKEHLSLFDYEFEYRETYNSGIIKKANRLDSNIISVLESKDYGEPSLLLYNDGRILEVFVLTNNYTTGINTISYKSLNKRNFVFGYKDKEGDDWQSRGLLININTGKSKLINDVQWDGEELVGGKYFNIRKGTDYFVYKFYDLNLNKLDFELETKGRLTSVQNEWVIADNKMYNILNGNSYDLDIVDGKYYVNKYAILVKADNEANTFYLYQFV